MRRYAKKIAVMVIFCCSFFAKAMDEESFSFGSSEEEVSTQEREQSIRDAIDAGNVKQAVELTLFGSAPVIGHSGHTQLTLAASLGDAESVNTLLYHRWMLPFDCPKNKSAFLLAVDNGDEDCVQEFLMHPMINYFIYDHDEQGETPAQNAFRKKRYPLMTLILSKKADPCGIPKETLDAISELVEITTYKHVERAVASPGLCCYGSPEQMVSPRATNSPFPVPARTPGSPLSRLFSPEPSSGKVHVSSPLAGASVSDVPGVDQSERIPRVKSSTTLVSMGACRREARSFSLGSSTGVVSHLQK